MKLPKKLLTLMSFISNMGYEVYLVGGAIRDYLLNIKIDDYDLTTNMPPASIIEMCEQLHLNYNDRGLKHDTVGVVYSGFYVEITCYRGLDKNSLFEDVKLRDFTMNSLVYDLENKKIIDLVDGEKDINNKIIRSYYPDKEFVLDPLRILRMYRFKAKYHFDIDPSTYKNALLVKSKLLDIAKERIQTELNYIVKYDAKLITNMLSDGVLEILLKDIIHINNIDIIINDINNIFIKNYELEIKYALLFFLLASKDISKAIVIAKDFTNYYLFPNKLKKDILKILEILTLDLNKSPLDLLVNLIADNNYSDIDLKRSFIFLNIINNKLLKINNYNNIIKTKSLYLKKKRNKELLSFNDLLVSGNDIIDHTNAKNNQIGEIKKEIFKLCLYDNNKNNKDYLINYLKERK